MGTNGNSCWRLARRPKPPSSEAAFVLPSSEAAALLFAPISEAAPPLLANTVGRDSGETCGKVGAHPSTGLQTGYKLEYKEYKN